MAKKTRRIGRDNRTGQFVSVKSAQKRKTAKVVTVKVASSSVANRISPPRGKTSVSRQAISRAVKSSTKPSKGKR